MAQDRAFFAYPSEPPTRSETMREAARKIATTGTVATETWEDLRVTGSLIIDKVLAAMDGAEVVCCEVTDLNPNVMFELGYAVGSGKRVWPMFDESDGEADVNWKRLRLLTTLGFAPYISSDDVRAQFLKDMPHVSGECLFDSAIRPRLQPSAQSDLFYVKGAHPTDASRELTRKIDHLANNGRRIVVFDPTESSVYPLTWFAQQIYDTSVTVVHLAARRQRDALIHNSRAALIAGMAVGMQRSLLIATEAEPSLAPLDYRDLAYTYRSASDLGNHVEQWLAAQNFAEMPEPARAIKLELGTELRGINFGEPVAENEADALASYFVETAGYREVLERATTVFVGRKGAGKSANFLRASAALEADARNLVCVIQPSGYELEAVVRLLSQFGAPDERSFAVETLWQYLLMTEIAVVAAENIRHRFLPPDPTSAEGRLLDYVDDPDRGLEEEFAIRLERVVEAIGVLPDTSSVEAARAEITAALHAGELQELRRLLGEALQGRERVCVLIDNLDKAWERTADLDQLAYLLLGLLAAVRKVSSTFQKKDVWRRPVHVSLAVFLRSDIFEKLTRVAREPDKIPVSRLAWSDPHLLLRVIEERYQAGHEDSPEGELWDRYFTPQVAGLPTTDYILRRILPRPRDLVQFCSFALNSAVNHRRDTIEADDIRDAEKLYSQFAFEALLVENGLTIDELESVLFEFAGGDARLDPDWAEDAVLRAGLLHDRVPAVVARLRQLSFLGIETRDGAFAYEEDARDEKKFAALARNLEDMRGAPARYEIHPAFRPYLEIEDP